MRVTTNEFDRIRNQVTINAFAIIDADTCEMVAKIKTTRPCRMRTGMENFSTIVELFRNENGEKIYESAIGKAGGCGYDKSIASQLNALKDLGFATVNSSGGWIDPQVVIVKQLNLNNYRIFSII